MFSPFNDKIKKVFPSYPKTIPLQINVPFVSVFMWLNKITSSMLLWSKLNWSFNNRC